MLALHLALKFGEYFCMVPIHGFWIWLINMRSRWSFSGIANSGSGEVSWGGSRIKMTGIARSVHYAPLTKKKTG